MLGVAPMTETEQFLATMPEDHRGGDRTAQRRLRAAHRDVVARRPLTLFGAAISGRGWGEIGPIFDTLGQQFSGCLSYQNQIVAAEASGDLAYTVALDAHHGVGQRRRA